MLLFKKVKIYIMDLIIIRFEIFIFSFYKNLISSNIMIYLSNHFLTYAYYNLGGLIK